MGMFNDIFGSKPEEDEEQVGVVEIPVKQTKIRVKVVWKDKTLPDSVFDDIKDTEIWSSSKIYYMRGFDGKKYYIQMKEVRIYTVEWVDVQKV